MTKIEWTDQTWNPVTGCDKVSQGCKNCYAEIMHRRLRGMFPDKYSQPFLGHVQVHEDELKRPLEWKKPRMVFVNSMSDLFHDDVPFSFIYKVFAVMDVCHRHTFQILTKRPDRMLEFTKNYPVVLPNVWLGVSCEDQNQADLRIPLLLQTRAAIRLVSCEPLLSQIKLYKYIQPLTLHSYHLHKQLDVPVIDWVIVGGESGHKARPMHPDWVRSIRDECKFTDGGFGGVSFFFKQWGEWAYNDQLHHADLKIVNAFYNSKDHDFGDGIIVHRVGKSKSGNQLDGISHQQFPTIYKNHEEKNLSH